ncbi:MAG: zeta toxin family protein [Parachlamydiaceae bacterium]|nr:zeta toxin family protein [Parachlamydiaceae bacterium]
MKTIPSIFMALTLVMLPIFANIISIDDERKIEYNDPKEQVIIFLNGTSSAGKSSIAFKLQEHFKEPMLHVGCDHFSAMMHPKYFSNGLHADQGYSLIPETSKPMPAFSIHKGPVGYQLSYAMHRAMKSLADNGFDLVIDEVLFAEDDFLDYQNIFHDYRVYFIAVKPPLEVVEQREIERGDRVIGLARGLYDHVYMNKSYDMEIDSSKMTPDESATEIMEYIDAHPYPRGLQSN